MWCGRAICSCPTGCSTSTRSSRSSSAAAPTSRTRSALLAELIPQAKNDFASKPRGGRTSYRQAEAEGGRYTVDTPVPYRIDDLVAAAESRMGKLENRDIAVQYQRLLHAPQRRAQKPALCLHLRRAGRRWRHHGRYPVPAVPPAVGRGRCRSCSLPVSRPRSSTPSSRCCSASPSSSGCGATARCRCSIVCEEAHNYANVDRSLGFRPAREALSRIAKEGRKYGVFLGLVTQRPAQLDHTLISQCSHRVRDADGQRGRPAHRPRRRVRSGQPAARLPCRRSAPAKRSRSAPACRWRCGCASRNWRSVSSRRAKWCGAAVSTTERSTARSSPRWWRAGAARHQQQAAERTHRHDGNEIDPVAPLKRRAITPRRG